MIVFEGHMAGSAEKQLFKRSRIIGQIILSLVFISIFPIIMLFYYNMRNWRILVFYGLMVITMFLLTFIPKSAKEKQNFLPVKIYIENEFIVCVSPTYTESRLISDVKRVDKYDEFYELIFPFGKMTEKFILQKNLLKNGTLEDFEKVFNCDIVER